MNQNQDIKQSENQDNKVPKSWKMLLIGFAFVYPAINIIFFFLGDFLFGLPQYLRTFLMAGLFVPLFGICIPLLQNKLRNWTTK